MFQRRSNLLQSDAESGGSCMCTSRCRAKLYHFETSTTKNLFDNCCYLYISMILVILEVVFQVFLRLLRIPQYSNQWAFWWRSLYRKGKTPILQEETIIWERTIMSLDLPHK
nr:hypothetical protein CFP56_14367 [Quercus suber]